ncbi:class I SAM-dependent methyltransferase [Nonomuraea sp. NPDC050556]|uniref:class I SAM-dependent methyltransferase n=1 Tax=Nonomuraea sp. NPDC050556 TaxID=3364369 RepID=UPI0037B807EB
MSSLGMEQFHHPRAVCQRSRLTPARESLMRGLSGAVMEMGVGDGVKFRFYPAEVREITAVDPDPGLCETAREGCGGLPVRVLTGSFSAMPVPDGSVDAVVCSLTLCAVPRQDEALREIVRVLKPGGELRFYEHVRSANPVVAFTERLVGPLWAQSSGGCHPARDTLRAITSAGFTLDRVDRFDFDRIAHVLGVARR